MTILPIEQITPEQQKELDKLQEDKKHRALTIEEESRVLFLEIKQFWNCEC